MFNTGKTYLNLKSEEKMLIEKAGCWISLLKIFMLTWSVEIQIVWGRSKQLCLKRFSEVIV